MVKAELLGRVLDFLVAKASVSSEKTAPPRPLMLGRGCVIENEQNQQEVLPFQATTCSAATKAAIGAPTDDDTSNSSPSLPDLVGHYHDDFVNLQRSDDSLKDCFNKVENPSDESHKLPLFYLENNILMRHFRYPTLTDKDSWRDCHQLVAPGSLRSSIMKLAHSAESHLGITKTYRRLLEDFYWPRMNMDVKSFVDSLSSSVQWGLGRVHQTLKNLLRRYGMETEKEWDEDIDLLLYILRSVPNESTGVFPFEMMFGQRPRLNLSMIKEQILKGSRKENQVGLPQYFKSLEKLLHIHAFARKNLQHAQELMKDRYDKKAKVREFKCGDKVLVYRCVPGSPLREKCMGPLRLSGGPQKQIMNLPQTVKDSCPLPRITDIIDSVSNAKYLPQIDLLKGYYQTKLTERAKKASAFITPFGLFEYNVLPFSLTNAPATFQRTMQDIIRGVPHVYVYLDDIVVATTTWEEHLRILTSLFERLREVDASNTGFGGVLLQEIASDGAVSWPLLERLLPIAYHSGFFKGSQLRWATVEKELFRIINTVLHFRPYLEVLDNVLVYSDHMPLSFLHRAKFTNKKLLKWSYILSSFNIEVRKILRSRNIIADALSRQPRLHRS
ncbi:uncharacterized protein [Palaemon carinicauda]|uniref:uncharacterized protein n=1 Tax=Palaemon carinicauda TaxID=392227 RepID=UPI0035B5BD91